MYKCFTEFHPLWIEFIKLGPSKQEAFSVKLKRFKFRWSFKTTPIERHGDYATTRRSLFVQFGNFVVTILWHWNPIPEWSLELLEECRLKGQNVRRIIR